MSAQVYEHLIDQFLSRAIGVDLFIEQYMRQWRYDRDHGGAAAYDPRLQRLLDRIFTSCDCFGNAPEGPPGIPEAQLRQEVHLLHYIWWG